MIFRVSGDIYDDNYLLGFFLWEKDKLFFHPKSPITCEELKHILTEMERLIAERNKSPFCTFDE